MNRHVIFKTLWLVSERDRKARQQVFDPKKTLLLGTNGTGKSRVVKNLFWVLGCAPEKHTVAAWDPDTLAALEFSFNDVDYLVMRQNKRLGLFSVDGGLLFSAENMAVWEKFIAPFFGYHLKLQRPNVMRFSQAGMDYLTLPFYVDQDGSWGANWDTYSTLGQFKSWKPAAFEAFIGLRPNAYFQAKQLRDEVRGQLAEKKKELEAQRVAFSKVREVLPRHLPSLDLTTFRAELAELGRKTMKVQQEQVKLRGRLVALVNLREKLQAEGQLARATQAELIGDLEYLSAVSTSALECPTCGTVHENSFHARLQLSQDSGAMSAFVAEVDNRLVDVREDEAIIRAELRAMEKKLTEVSDLMHTKRANIRLDDVLAAHSKRTLNLAFQRVTTELGTRVSLLSDEEEKHDIRLKTFEDKNRQKAVGKYFTDQVNSISILLNIPAEEHLPKAKPGARAQTGGSSAPRSTLAVHLALLRTNVEYGDSPLFPFVVDTPQQSGQDDDNLRSMIEQLGRSAGGEHQVILAVEKLPQNVDISEFKVVNFLVKKGALAAEDFESTMKKLAPLRELLRASIDASLKKEAARAQSGAL